MDLRLCQNHLTGLEYDWLVTGAHAFYKTAYAFVFSKDLFQKSWDSIEIQLHKRPISSQVYERSVQFGEQVAAHILQWAKQDNYGHTRTLPRFTLKVRKRDCGGNPRNDFIEAIGPSNLIGAR